MSKLSPKAFLEDFKARAKKEGFKNFFARVDGASVHQGKTKSDRYAEGSDHAVRDFFGFKEAMVQIANQSGGRAAMQTFGMGIPSLQQVASPKPVTAGVSASQVGVAQKKTQPPNPMASIVKPPNVTNPAQQVAASAQAMQAQGKTAELTPGAGLKKPYKLEPGEISPENLNMQDQPVTNYIRDGVSTQVSAAFNHLVPTSESSSDSSQPFINGSPGI